MAAASVGETGNNKWGWGWSPGLCMVLMELGVEGREEELDEGEYHEIVETSCGLGSTSACCSWEPLR